MKRREAGTNATTSFCGLKADDAKPPARLLSRANLSALARRTTSYHKLHVNRVMMTALGNCERTSYSGFAVSKSGENVIMRGIVYCLGS
jgi:hypothetical protein